MSSNQSQLRLLVKNTFIDSLDDSDFSPEPVMQRFRSEPTLMLSSGAQSPQIVNYCASCLERVPGQGTQQDLLSGNLLEGAPKERKQLLEEMDVPVSCSMNSIGSKASTCGSNLDLVESWGDAGSEFVKDVDDYALAASNESCGSSMSLGASFTLHGGRSASKFHADRGVATSRSRTQTRAKAPDLNRPSCDVPSSPVTTLMLCNLPCRLSQEGLAQAVDQLGFERTYDLVYIPRGYQNFIGYGFINFLTPEDAERFGRTISSVTFSTRDTKKRVSVVVAKDQGLAKNLEAIRKGGNFRKRAHAPLVFYPVV